MNEAQKAALDDLKEAVKLTLPAKSRTLNPEGTGRMKADPAYCEYEAGSVATVAAYVKDHTEESRVLANSVKGLRANQQCFSHASAVAHLIELAEAQAKAPETEPPDDEVHSDDGAKEETGE